MTLRTVRSGAVVGIGLVVGTIGGSGVASANVLGALGVPVALSTTTTLTVSAASQTGDSAPTVTETATVTLQNLKGAFLTPSGSVQFEASTESPGGSVSYPTQTVTLSHCLLGLAPVAGLWQATCSASTTLTLTSGTCNPTVFEAEYSGSSDLLAGPSESNRPVLPAQCTT
jgi:hypothetical protein